MKKYIIVGIVFIGAVVFAINMYLGGSEELTFSKESKSLWFKGERFRGRYSDPKIEELFFNARELAMENDRYTLAVINYQAPEDTVDQAVGVISDAAIELGEMTTQKAFDQDFLKTIITSHNLVMPKPEEVMRAAKKYASNQNLLIDDSWTLEIYEGERTLKVLIPIKN